MPKSKVYSGINNLPSGNASDRITQGCIVLEGGAFRGLYGEGVLDALMENDINLQCTVGVSAGAMNGLNYVSGQIGRSARFNLRYRHDPRYVSLRKRRQYGGVISFDFVLKNAPGEPMNMERFLNPRQQFVAVVTNCLTGETEYMDKETCSDIFKAVQASASMPYLSKMVNIDGVPYLDGGCSTKIAYQWALDQNFEKIVVVRTRPDAFRYEDKKSTLPYRVYRAYPQFAKKLATSHERYNKECDQVEALREQGRIFVISPSKRLPVSRLEGDMEKLGALYQLGYQDGLAAVDKLKSYLAEDVH